MMIKNLIIIVFLFAFVMSANAQKNKAEKKIIDGKEFYIHKVKRGNTLYGLHKMYEVPIDEITKSNPGASAGLTIGEEILIPTGKAIESIATDDPDPIIKDVTPVTDPNKDYEKHVVKSGETLYSIARQYGLKGKDLIAVNGDKPLKIGEVILVPVPKTTTDTNEITDEVDAVIKDPFNQLAEYGDSIILHTVVAGETMYSLARKYDTTQDKILKINDGLVGGLKIGQEIRIPIKVEITDINLENDTLSLDSNVVAFTAEIKEVYNIGVFLPFKLDKFQAQLLKCPSFGECNPYFSTVRAVEFYNGVEMAIDSLKNAGLNLNVYVYDTKGDTATFNKLLKKNEVKDLDLAFGPLTSRNQFKMAKFAQENQFRFITPVSSSNKLLFKNKYVTKAIPSKPTQVRAMASYLAKNQGHENIILMTNKSDKEHTYLVKAFEESFNMDVAMNPAKRRDSILTLSAGRKLANVSSHIVTGDTNILVVPSKDIGYISAFLTDLNKMANQRGSRNTHYMVFGLEDWLDMDQLDSDYLIQYNLNVVASRHINYNNRDVLKFIQKYRAKHANDPSDYSFIGFDVMMNQLAGILHFGTGAQANSNLIQLPTVQMDFNYEPAGVAHGYENKACYIVGYEEGKMIRKY